MSALGPPPIYKACYSGVPVYEFNCKNIAVMKRRSDEWMNATQILKVANFDKPQRTRILEREVQKGVHEKVQGGYGKYQGTWIPMARSVDLVKQYRIQLLLDPIINYHPGSQSPPLAPKHATASGTRARKQPSTAHTLPSTSKVFHPLSSAKHPAKLAAATNAKAELSDGEDASIPSSPSFKSNSSRTPSPIRFNARKRKLPDTLNPNDTPSSVAIDGSVSYEDIILDYFISESTQIPALLIHPPADFNPNMSIDDEGHTAMHWACAMGKVRVVKLLLSAGADIFRVNHSEQTALMRSVMFSNNYDIRKFPQLYELLHRSTLNLDKHDRTVLHHIVDLALTKSKTHAARYYMECVLAKLVNYPDELADVINFQDDEGESALTLAARARSKRLVKLLLEHGADSKLPNKDGRTAEDYILEDERFRQSPLLNSNHLRLHPPDTSIYAPPPHLFSSETSQSIANTTMSGVANLLENLAQSYDKEITQKERDYQQAQVILRNIKTDIVEAKQTVEKMTIDGGEFEQLKAKLKGLEGRLEEHSMDVYKRGWAEYNDKIDEGGKMDMDTSNLGNENGDKDVHYQCTILREQINSLHHKRIASLHELIKRQKEVGTGKKMSEYRKLISVGCGIPTTEIDGVLEMLLESLESENSKGGKGVVRGKAGSDNMSGGSASPTKPETLDNAQKTLLPPAHVNNANNANNGQ
ncbi:hypothetical protein E3P89_03440 [Wallemia ichthyophaga]|uniref:HTH APSES-type domain-containing protein n=1 Tax=Wallemia ichthyophaga TaxID=245174 RepID=A0A4T0I0H5_WALIC|nr:hypothetical protein E3P93_03423 [Wallemia ichthyophaga]TIB09071.1 hypothetical protein E3P90_03423 [Wallemia ichthyophaga]TIB20065.1 hypothetical protein E3P89_03440 [Wallemia ichthyophaga]TIB21590.1 hypothetical protein E3P88_03430 [Wallemia ichthyophaga]